MAITGTKRKEWKSKKEICDIACLYVLMDGILLTLIMIDVINFSIKKSLSI